MDPRYPNQPNYQPNLKQEPQQTEPPMQGGSSQPTYQPEQTVSQEETYQPNHYDTMPHAPQPQTVNPRQQVFEQAQPTQPANHSSSAQPPYGQPAGQQPYGQQQYYQPNQNTNDVNNMHVARSKANLSLTFSLVSGGLLLISILSFAPFSSFLLLIGIGLSIAGIVCGARARKLSGGQLGTAGFVLSIITLCLCVLLFIIMIFAAFYWIDSYYPYLD